ncbi:MAG: type II toxin-antitoxin system RelE/ParE family toxin [Planctomycetales bacterium]|nr:type II toxin-antitoxin system RelE/ParE family toxin [Planctomycetales bacterium]
MARLAQFPRLGARIDDIANREVRELLYGKYRIVYEFTESADAVYLLAVFHSAIDIDRLNL